jgi:UDP-GlcNAc:undecaprenyl-phosphate GlcNAc-1-phosphate transferase
VPFLIALGVGLLLMPAAILVGVRSGFVDTPSPIRTARSNGAPVLLKIHARPVSQLGGPAVVAATLVALAVAGSWPPAAVGAAVAGATVLGVLDDAKPLPPLPRAIGLALAGAAVALGGWTIEPLGVLGGVAAAVAVFASANAVNLVDGQDGLAGGLVAIGALGVAAVARIGGSDPATGLALAAALVAFLWWNREPARVFLGNGGAYGVGVLLAVAAIEAARADLAAVGGVVVCLGVLEAELVLTILRRLRRGGRLTEGDRDHSYDVVAVRLGSRRRSTTWFWIAAATCSALGVLVARAPLAGAIAAGVLLVFGVPIVRRLLKRVEVRR